MSKTKVNPKRRICTGEDLKRAEKRELRSGSGRR